MSARKPFLFRAALFAMGMLVIAGGMGGAEREAQGGPTVWAKARNPGLADSVHWLKYAESLMLEYERIQDERPDNPPPDKGLSYVTAARKVLEERIGAKDSADPMIRYRYAQVLYELREYQPALDMYASVARSPGLSEPFRASALSALGTCYAHVERRTEEIAAYTDALKLTTYGASRANILANRAEAYMATGDLNSAVNGYREALSSLATLHPIEMAFYSVTPLWGLGVALDRSGDLEDALESIRLARAYDPGDRLLRRPTWFFAPPHDEAWYWALGAWERARRDGQDKSPRAHAYLDAIAAWRRYIEKAPEGDPYKALAQARLSACEKESRKAALGSISRELPKKLKAGPGLVPLQMRTTK